MSVRWENIWPLAVDDAVSDELKSRAAKHEKDVNALKAARSKLDTDRHAFKSAAADDLEGKQLLDAAKFASREVDILAAELSLRDEAAALYIDHKAAIMTLLGAAFTAHEKARADILQKLVEIGYHAPVEGVVDVCRVQPGWIQCHPVVLAALNRHRELFDRSHDNAFAKANTESIRVIRDYLQRIKDRYAAA